MVALMPEGAAQNLARAPQLSVQASHFAEAFEAGKDFQEVGPHGLEALERVRGNIVLALGER
jgi:hypothetical protein